MTGRRRVAVATNRCMYRETKWGRVRGQRVQGKGTDDTLAINRPTLCSATLSHGQAIHLEGSLTGNMPCAENANTKMDTVTGRCCSWSTCACPMGRNAHTVQPPPPMMTKNVKQNVNGSASCSPAGVANARRTHCTHSARTYRGHCAHAMLCYLQCARDDTQHHHRRQAHQPQSRERCELLVAADVHGGQSHHGGHYCPRASVSHGEPVGEGVRERQRRQYVHGCGHQHYVDDPNRH